MKNDLVYIVDDSQLFQIAHSKLMTKIAPEATIKRFSRPKYALVNLRKDLRDKRKVILLLDIEMPEMSGIDVLRYIAKSEFLNHGELSVFLVSSAIQRFLKDDITNNFLVKGLIEKPATMKKLNGILHQFHKNINLKMVS